MPPLPLSPERQAVVDETFDCLQMTDADVQALAERLFWESLAVYNATLTAAIAEVGRDGEGDLTEPDEIARLRRRAQEMAESIARTYNDELAAQILGYEQEWVEEHEDKEGIGFLLLLVAGTLWAMQRARWKSTQIAVTEGMWTIGTARLSFFQMNRIVGKARVVPTMAVCPICQAMVARGEVPLEEARQAFILPVHPNCPHFLLVTFVTESVPVGEGLWRGSGGARANPYHKPKGVAGAGRFTSKESAAGASVGVAPPLTGLNPSVPIVRKTALSPEETQAKLNDALYDVPQVCQAGLKSITVMDKPGPEFKASSGEKFTEGGSYDWDTQAMIVRDFGPASAWQVGTLLTHEFGHHVHRKAIADSLIEQQQAKSNRPEMYDAAGKLKSEFAQVFRKEAPLTTALKDFKKAYARGDGITEYSKSWRGDDSETVAEYAKLRWEQGAAHANTVASRTKAGQSLSNSLNTLFNLMESGKYRSADGETATIAEAGVRQDQAGESRLEMKFFSGEGVEVEPSEADYAVALEFDDEGGLVKSTWYWPRMGSAPSPSERGRFNPYHEPAGSPVGGQFAKSPGGGGALAVAGMSATEAQAALGDVASWEGPRRKYAREACLTAARRRYGDGLAMRHDGELVGVAALDQSGDRLFVDFLATKRPGYGREMMRAICQRAAAQGQRVTLAATPASRGFYKRIGMRARFGVDFFEFSAQAAAAYGQRLEPGEDEPEDGVFTVPIAQWPEDVKAEMLGGEAEGR